MPRRCNRTARRFRPMLFEAFEPRMMLAGRDVNNDGVVAPNDALAIVNYLNANGAGCGPMAVRWISTLVGRVVF